MSDSRAFSLLDDRIQRYLWAEGWEELRDAQEQAIPLIVPADRDVIIAAATATGKTEAAFLPALTHLLQREPDIGLIVYISPLKALINDQFSRLARLCENLEIPVWPWHGDIAASRKAKFWKAPTGVVLITPESLEAMLCNRGSGLQALAANLTYWVVDELHAFIGTERGKQVHSLMHRLDRLAGRAAPRIGLSATLGDMRLAAEYLRPGAGGAVALVESRAAQAALKVVLKGYEVAADAGPMDEEQAENEAETATLQAVALDLFAALRDGHHLVFPNSRAMVELLTHKLNLLCAQAGAPACFWPHHGNLSKEIREATEAALKQRERPATAVCTSTLELGIDIGAVKSVAQIMPPPSVASLRQRLGRSGRRPGEAAILRGYVMEDTLSAKSCLEARLRLATVELAAMIELLLEGWFEPPPAAGLHASTLVHQILALIAQYGGMSARQAYQQLCAAGAPFAGLEPDAFAGLLRELGRRELLMQESSGLLLHGPAGEKRVNHYSFYAVFVSEQEYRVVAGERVLGSMPIDQMLIEGQLLIFAGQTWRVETIDEPGKTVYVSRAPGGKPPHFSGPRGLVHTRVRKQMRRLLAGAGPVAFLDPTAQRFLDEARREYQRLDLGRARYLVQGDRVLVLTWLGDAANAALAQLLSMHGVRAQPFDLGVDVEAGRAPENVLRLLTDLCAAPVPEPEALLRNAQNLAIEKWDWALPDSLLKRAYASLRLDVDEAIAWCRGLA